MGFFAFGTGYFGEAQAGAFTAGLRFLRGLTRFILGFKRSTRDADGVFSKSTQLYSGFKRSTRREI